MQTAYEELMDEEPRISKLPVWAQSLLCGYANRHRSSQLALASIARDGTGPVHVGDHPEYRGPLMRLPVYTEIRFHPDWIDGDLNPPLRNSIAARLAERGAVLNISAGRQIHLAPISSNLIEIHFVKD